MPYDPNYLREAQRRLEDLKARHRHGQTERLAALYAKLPRLGQVDAALRGTVATAVAAALRKGGDPTAAVEQVRVQNLALQAERGRLLAGEGLDPHALDETPLCPLCRDTGWVKGGGMCGCLKTLYAQENRKGLSRALDFTAMDFSNFSLDWYSTRWEERAGMSPREGMEMIFNVCLDYAQQFPRHPFRNLYLYGGTGLGKTLLSGAIANTVSREGHWVMYETAGALFAQYETQKFSRDTEDAAAAKARVARYETCTLLIVDDLGSELVTPFVHAALYALLNARINGGLHTVVSSNLSPDDIRRRYTPQISSRLEGEYHALGCLGEDIRLLKKDGSLGSLK